MKINTSKPLKTPVLFLIFNRLDTTMQVFNMIKLAKPPRLYIAADGPRKDKKDETEKVKNVRDFVLNSIDWDCEIKKLFRDENLGCGLGVSSAIAWFFENEEEGIILEDDCLPSLSFFFYCEFLLEKYRNDNRIMKIGGSKFSKKIWGDGSYYFTKFGFVWGWASWRRAWKSYDYEMKSFPEFKKYNVIASVWENQAISQFWMKLFENLYFMKNKDTWDIQWTYAIYSHGCISISPNVNLISNIGIGNQPTHEENWPIFANEPVNEIFDMIEPSFPVWNKDADYFVFNKGFSRLYTNYFCTVCNSVQNNFLPMPDFYKNKAKEFGFIHFGKGEMTSIESYSCPSCGASDRERLMAYWIINNLGAKILLNSKILHFAPEPALSNFLKNFKFSDYHTVDFSMENVDFNVDITNLPFADSLYDFFICSHILEHVGNDDKAINELYRITKPGGLGIIMVPISTALEHTIEDINAATEDDRWKYFGQNDHLRLYSHNDFTAKIKRHGFILHKLGVEHFGSEVFIQLGLKETSILYIAEKPLQKIDTK